MMAKLTDLPYDIKDSILRQVDERSSLLALISTCRLFYEIFTQYKDSILHNLYLSEALSYGPDSIFFTYCRQVIPNIDDLTTLSDTIEEYKQFIRKGTPPSFLKIENGEYNPRKLARSIVDDYLGIRKIALAHQYGVRTARNEPGLSPSELHRIMQALYRGWILVLLLNKRLELEPSKPNGQPGDECIERLVITWDIWDVLRIQEVLGESLRVLPIGQVDMNNAWGFDQFEADIPKSGLKEMVEKYLGDQRVVLIFPISSMDSYPSTSAPFALSTDFAQYLFVNHDPATISALYTLSSTPDAKTVYDRMATHIPTAMEGYLQYKASQRGVNTQMPLDTLQYTISAMLGWYGPISGRVGFEGMEIKGMRLVTGVNWLKGKVFRKKAKYTGPDSWLQWARLSGCVYDDSRLEGRGLEWPIFEY